MSENKYVATALRNALKRIKELEAENERLREAHQKTLDDSETGVVPRCHLNHIAKLLENPND